jgi:hypothetical protein
LDKSASTVEHLAHNHRLAFDLRRFEGLHLERMNDVPELDNLFAG